MGYEDLKFNSCTFLITGGAGFIGSNLCEVLVDMGYTVRCLDNLSTGKMENISPLLNHKNFIFINGDIRDFEVCKEACKDVTFVLHQAAWGSIPRSIEMPLFYQENNIGGTLNIFEAARINKVHKVVYASSSSVYGDSTILPKTEGSEGNVLSPYAFTKKACEEYAKLYKQIYGVDTYGLRYFNVFGRRQDPYSKYSAVIPRFIKQLLMGESPFIYGNGQQSRDFTYVDNIIEANLKACLAPSSVAGKSFNIAYSEETTLLELYNYLCDLLHIYVEPKFSDSRLGDVKHSLADISLAKKDLNYSPRYSLKDGLLQAIEWYKSYLL